MRWGPESREGAPSFAGTSEESGPSPADGSMEVAPTLPLLMVIDESATLPRVPSPWRWPTPSAGRRRHGHRTGVGRDRTPVTSKGRSHKPHQSKRPPRPDAPTRSPTTRLELLRRRRSKNETQPPGASLLARSGTSTAGARQQACDTGAAQAPCPVLSSKAASAGVPFRERARGRDHPR